MSDNTPEKVNDLLEAAINNSKEAWDAQSRYFDDLVRRNVASFTALSDARMKSLKAIGESQSFNQAFETNIAYEQNFRDALNKMHEENAQAWDDLQVKLNKIYAPVEDE
jgi:hypothetical protein